MPPSELCDPDLVLECSLFVCGLLVCSRLEGLEEIIDSFDSSHPEIRAYTFVVLSS